MDASNSNRSFNVKIEDLPEKIQEQFTDLKELKERIDDATQQAINSKEEAINVVGHRLSTKQVLNNLQDATFDLADGLVKSMDAQRYSFDYQRKLAETSKYLFELGLTNISMNRTIVKELELRLSKASEEEIDETTRSEIQNLIKQLKLQQDLEYKQTELRNLLRTQSSKVSNNEQSILDQAEKDKEHDTKIDELYSLISKQDELIEKMLDEIQSLRTDIYSLEEKIAKLNSDGTSVS